MFVKLLETTIIREHDDGSLILNSDTGESLYVNRTGLLFLKVLDGTIQDTEHILQLLSKLFDDAPISEFSNDFYDFLDQMAQKGIVRVGKIKEDVDKYRLSSMLVELTMQCNERCIHCYIPNSVKSKATTMPFDIFSKLVDEFVDLGGENVTLSGGEPLMHKDIIQILDYCQKKGLTINLFSNLLLLTEHHLDILSQNKVGVIQTSVYSLNPTIHNSITLRKGSLEKTLESIDRLLDANINVQISCPVFQKNRDSIIDIIDYAQRKGISLRMNAALLPQSDGNDSFANSNALTTDEWRCLLYKMAEYAPKYVRSNIVEHNKLCAELYLTPKEFLSSRICDAGISSCSVSPSGDVFPCTEWHSYLLGNICESSLSDIWYKSPSVRLIRQINQQKNFRQCLGCDALDYCKRCFAYYEHANNGELLRTNKNNCKDAFAIRELFEKYYDEHD